MAGIFGLLMSGAGVIKDQYFNLTSLLLPGNGTNGAQNNTFLDASTNNFTITRNGNTTQGTFSPFSQTGWGNYFNGSSDYLTLSSNSAITLSTGNFTIEFFAYKLTSWTDSFDFLDGATNAAALYVNAGAFSMTKQNVAGTTRSLGSLTSLSTNVWHHFVVIRESGNLRAYVNGSPLAAAQSDVNDYSVSITKVSGTADGYFDGYISNLRISKSAVYSVSASSIPVPTTPLTNAVSNCGLLTCQSNRFVDNSGNNLTITASGSPSVQAFSPFNPLLPWTAANNGGSGYFDGSGDSLTVPSSSPNQFGSGDFTLESWYYCSGSIATAGQHLFFRRTTVAPIGMIFQVESSKLNLLAGDSNTAGWEVNISSSSTLVANTWYHLAATRSGSTWRIFVNGTIEATATASFTIAEETGNISVGSNIPGYLASWRAVKGIAVYTAAFTPPTAPLTATQSANTNGNPSAAITGSETALLLNFTNAGIYDATSKNDLETVGNAQISTTQSKWGGGSMYFDGTSTTGLTIPNSSLLTLGSGDWSIEFWIYRVGNSTTQGVFDQRTAAATEIRPLIYINSSNQIVYYTNGADRITASLSQNTWVYVAVVKSSGVTRMYIDGTVQATTYTDTNTYLAPTNQTRIGRLIDGFPLNGYIDDFRITLGRARTTTASPTAPFPVQ